MADIWDQINNRTPDWAQASYERAQKRKIDKHNREQRALAAVSNLEKQSGKELTPNQMSFIMNREYAGEAWDTSELPGWESGADFSNVESYSDVVSNEPPTLPERISRTARAAWEGSKLNEMSEEYNESVARRDGRSMGTSIIEGMVGEEANEFLTTPIDELIFPSRKKERLDREDAERSVMRDRIKEQEKVVGALQDELSPEEKRISNIAGGILSQTEQAGPILGGLAGSFVGQPGLGAALGSSPLAQDAYNAAYTQAREGFGATEEEAGWYAEAMSAIEFGTEAAGGKIVSGVIGKMPKAAAKKAIANELTKRIRGRASRIAGAAAVSGAGEVATGLVQQGFSEAVESAEVFDSPEARAKLKEANAKAAAGALDTALDNFAAGAVVGGGIATPTSFISHAYESGKQTSEFIAAAEAGFRADVAPQKQAVAEEQAEEATKQAKTAAFDKAEATKAAKAEWDVSMRSNSAQDPQALAETLAKKHGVTSEDILSTPDTAPEITEQEKQDQMEAEWRNQELRNKAAAENEGTLASTVLPDDLWTAEDIANERERSVVAEERAADAKMIKERREAAELKKKRAEEAQKRAATAAQRAQTTATNKQRRAILDELITKYPDASDADLSDMLRETLASQPAATPVKPTAPTKPTPAAAKPVKPKAAPKPVEVEPTVEETIQDSLSKSGIDLSKPSLGSRDGSSTNIDTADYRDKVSRLGKALTKNNSKLGVDFQNLVRQGKLIIAPNAKAANREDNGNVAEYDINSGKTYLYLDSIDPDDAVGAIMKGVHEGTHVGQFNGREGRPSILRQVMGNDKYDNANRTIRQAAAKGNALAQRAVAAAEAAVGARDKALDADFVAQVELVPYFMEEAVKSRQGFGSLGGIVRDMIAGGKRMLNAVGADMDISLNDIESAHKQIMGEVVATDVKGLSGQGTLGTIIPSRVAATRIPKEREYVDPVDGETKFVLSDSNAELSAPEQLLDLLKSPKPLANILNHPDLYKQVPELRGVKVSILPESLQDQFTGRAINGGIELNPSVLENAADGDAYSEDYLRNVLLHEAQHIVQGMGMGSSGGSPALFFNESEMAIERAAYKSGLDTYNNGLALRDALQSDDNPEARFMSENMDGTTEGIRNVAREVLATPDEFSKHTVNIAKAAFRSAEDHLDGQYQLDNLYDKYHDDYLNIHGEREASWTERMSRTPQERLPVDPTAVSEDDGGLRGDNATASVTRMDRQGNAELTRRGPSLGSRNTDTTEFNSWFGNSQATNEDGSPRVYYTGTSKDKDFKAFNVPRNGTWFTDDPGIASAYAKDNDSMKTVMDDSPGASPWALKDVNTASRVFPVYIKAENPYSLTDDDFDFMNKDNYKRQQGILFDRLRAQGYDSVFMDPDRTVVVVLNDPAQIKSVNNSGKWDPKKKDVLGSRTPAQAPARKERLTPKWLKGLFSHAGGVGRVANEIIEYAQTSPAWERMIAEGYVGKFNNALAAEAKKRGMSVDTLRDQMIAAIEAIPGTSDDYKTNLAAYKEALKPFGQAADSMMDLRRLVDQMSFDILKQRFNSGVPITKKEAASYQAIAANLGRYAHRQYASMLSQSGRKYATTVWEDFLKSKKNGAKLSPQEIANAKRVSNAVKSLVDDINIPNDEDLSMMDIDDLRRLHTTWHGTRDDDGLTRQLMEDNLAAHREAITPKVLEEQAEMVAQEILGIMSPDGAGSLADFYRGGTLSKGIIQKRQNYDPAIRELMGEIKSPAMRLFATAAKQAEFVARTRMFLELSNLNDPYHVQPPGRTGRPEVRGMEPLQGESYGPMEGYFVSKELLNKINHAKETLVTFEQAAAISGNKGELLVKKLIASGLKGWGRIAGTTKMMSILGNPVRYGLNLMGSWQNGWINGNSNPSSYLKGIVAAGNIIRYSRNPTKGSEEARRLHSLGVTDSAFVGEIKSELYRDIVKEVEVMMKGSDKPPARQLMAYLGNKVRKNALTVKEAYAMADVWTKLANFYDQVDTLTEFYKAEGITKTPNEIDREAADRVSRTNITFKRTAPIVKNLETYGATMFAPYMYDVFRTQVNTVRQVFEDVGRAKNAKNAKARNVMLRHAGERGVGITAYWAMMGTAAHLANKALFDEDDEEKDKLRYLLPSFLRSNDFVKVGKGKDGKMILWQADQVDAFGPITDIMRYTMNDPEMDAAGVASSLLESYIAPRIGSKIVKAVIATAADKPAFQQEPLARQWFPEAYNNVSQFARDYLGVRNTTTRAWMNVVETAYPGITRAWSESNTTPTENQIAQAYKIAGGRFWELDPARTLNTVARSYKDGTSARRKEIEAYITDSSSTVSPERFIKFIGELEESSREEYDLVRNTYLGGLQAGASREELLAELKKHKMNKAEVNAIVSGEYEPTTVSKASFTTFKDRALKDITDKEERKRVEDKWDSVWDAIKGEEK